MIVAYPGAQVLDITGPNEVFAGANSARAGHPPCYRVRVASLSGGTVPTESGLAFATEPLDAIEPTAPLTLVVPGGSGVWAAAADPALVEYVARLADRAERLVTVCSGAFLAAAARLLEGRRVTTHWARARRLADAHPGVLVDPDPIYVRDGRVWSSAGVTAGIDLALAIVEDDHGPDVAQTIARWLVMFLRRPGGQTQFAPPVWAERAPAGPIRAAQETIEADPGADHRVGVLAATVGMSERHFTRRFVAGVGRTPAQYVIDVRVDAARRVLEESSESVEAVARRCGFGTTETMRRTFVDRVGVSPAAYRERFRTTPTHH